MKNQFIIILIFTILMSCKNTTHVGDIHTSLESINEFEIQGTVSSLFFENDKPIGFFLQDSRWKNFTAQYFHSSERIEIGDKIKLKTRKVEKENSESFFEVVKLSRISSNHTIQYKKVSFPLTENDLRQLLGSYVEIQNEMVVCNAYNYLKYGTLEVSTEPMIQLTEEYDAQNEKDKILRLNISQKMNTITLDDYSDSKYPESLYLEPSELKLGKNVSSIRGLISEYNGKLRLRVSEVLTQDQSSKHIFRDMKSGLIMMGFNVHNLFNGDGLGNGFPTQRGAKNIEQYRRQILKLKMTIEKVNPDILALMEIENDDFDSLSSLQQFCNFLNENSSRNYLICQSDQSPGSDQIKTALIYDSTFVKISKRGIYYPDSLFSRSPLFQEFSYTDSLQFVVSVNHFKSKNPRDAMGLNSDQNDGQSAYNFKRIQQARELLFIVDSFYQNIPLLVLGDFNAYTQEDPIQEISSSLDRLKTSAFSYLYKGRLGNLDHAFVNKQMSPFVKSIQLWDINASSPHWLDYKNDGSEHSYLRSSDHNPLIIHLY